MNVHRVWAVLAVLCVCLLGAAAVNWDKNDIEIFELQQALEQSEGPGASFYSILGLRPSASQSEIRKAYREKSLEWQYNPDMPDAYKRFERLGLIHKILRDERRDRYNHFLSNGFPKWRGTGYYYSRFRPGLLMVLIFLVVLSVAVEHLVRVYNFRVNQKRIENLRRSALALAWGAWFQTPKEAIKGTKPKSVPAQKKVRVPLHGFTDMPPAPSATAIATGQVDWDAEGQKVRQAVTAPVAATESMRIVDMMVFSDGSMAVIDDESGEWLTIEPLSDADAPTLSDAWPAALVRRFMSSPAAEPAPAVDTADATEPTTTSAKTSKTSAKRRKHA
ncbi:unnamed protein product [Malassezia sympodialis ATCC 42132]|uniref:uncharacterized protein n=1 Tax=Malassezia sympodialis (strain ATCC 42132) TaxID=1230383 RepID=UPI0002C19707|nr:uncharacterized protein MSY001_1583 [Malassezia sympodialis ATCC 42132]CCU98877.1 unnamed protein product [Malassezia sympodialis ATCC 42132]|eukprot:XP_018740158.1 uncharacterized protein MSY001_1583 [Malassezia sympodialis ATCC 42132]